jgi:hypothetical protein
MIYPSWRMPQSDRKDAMLAIYSAPLSAMVENVKNVLERDGIKCIVSNEYLSAGAGELPPIETRRESI